MMDRRDLLLGGGLLLGAGAALALTPRERLNLLGDKKMEALVPERFGAWKTVPSNALVLPKPSPGSLADRLYSQTVSRLYDSETDLPVMLVIAYGSTQSDQLQLHRPEVCYTAVGFQISASAKVEVPLGGRAMLPARELTAENDRRIEPILYWTRIGDSLPTTGSEQRSVKLRGELDGYISDGVLVRMSTVGEATAERFQGLQRFARAMIGAIAPASRSALIGRPLAAKLAGA
ncbi:exosortase-associated protein EpsI, V-type [Sandaracinobacteroides saxicola]|uniref:EpsI family protein n=1 Tax=Sandaracinobacteroides saxicola TaxID=2759707 RepID=A0A7G5IFB8_9SPHN|nr:exosortase-associated protein EpsI, V-type [Sandaracinobacteroides saxicola]QMW22060.1 EpsI family protein [Sandaracinobacteroides saxicola]